MRRVWTHAAAHASGAVVSLCSGRNAHARARFTPPAQMQRHAACAARTASSGPTFQAKTGDCDHACSLFRVDTTRGTLVLESACNLLDSRFNTRPLQTYFFRVVAKRR